MAKDRENGITILIGLKDYKVGEVWGREDKVVIETVVGKKQKKCPYCGSTRLYGHGSLRKSGDLVNLSPGWTRVPSC